MATTFSERFIVTTPDDLDELELALNEGGIASVMVDIPDSATALLGAREFRRIVGAARNVGTRLEFQTDDPLRRELARIVGARLAESPELLGDAQKTHPGSADDAPTRKIEPMNDRSEVSDNNEDHFRLWEPGRQAGHWSDPDRTDASYSFVITPPRREALVVTEPPVQTHEHWQASIPRFEDWERIAPVRTQIVRPSNAGRSRFIAATLVIGTLLTIAGLLAAFVVPTATIIVTPIVTPLVIDLTYGVALPGATWDVAIQPTPIENTVTFTASLPTTGERFEPDAAAAGALQLTNASTEEIVISAGASFLNDTGYEVTSVAEVVVPAADPYSSLMFGSASVEVVSAIAGPDGNIDSQVVFGQLDNGIFFVNREPLTGGTMKRIATVTQADQDALNEQARLNLSGAAPSALDGSVPQGRQIVPGSVEPGTVVSTFDHPVGADAHSVNVSASLRITAQTYDPAAALQLARQEAERRINESAGTNARLISESVAIDDPQPIEGANGVAFTLHTSASTESIIDTNTLGAIRSELTGREQGDAIARVQQVPGVAAVVIERDRAWIGDRLPRMTSRITFVFADATTTPELSTAHAKGLPTQAASSGSTIAGPGSW